MKTFGLIGEKLGHSLSPEIHRILFEELGIKATYSLFSVAKENIDVVPMALKTLGIAGVNITVPYKETWIEHLDEISDQAKKIGAINTIVIKNNQLIGYNTDYYGFQEMCRMAQVEVEGNHFYVLGSGGAAKSVIHYLLDHGAETVHIVTRNKELMSSQYTMKGIDVLSYEDLRKVGKAYGIINTTPVGMYPSVEHSPIGEDVLAQFQVALDVIYNPIETKFLQLAKKQGMKTANGLYMLIGQAIKAEELWQNRTIPKGMMDTLYERLKKRMNQKILLIGMPGAGKTTIGKQVAKEMGLQFIDMDRYIEKKQGQSITQLFERGEDYFRDIETSVCKEICKFNPIVIASGGGIVKKAENMQYFQDHNFTILYLNRPIAKILENIQTEHRPLLKKNKNQIETLYEERKHLYSRYCTKEIENQGEFIVAVKKIKELMK